jgi:hypothetical protein
MVTNVQNPMMAALLGPEAAQSQYQLAQNQRYADIMMQQALMEQPQGQMVSGHYVPASPVQGIAQLLKAYVGRSVADKIPEQQAAAGQAQLQQIQNMFAPTGGAAGGVGGGASGAGGAGGGQLSSLVPPGMTPQQAAFSMMISPDALVKALAANTSPTQTAKLLRESGINPNSPQGQQYMGQALEKDISQVLPPGSTLRGPNGMLNIPKVSENIQLQFSPQGAASAFAVPNAAQISAQNLGLEERAKAAGQAGYKLEQTATGPNQVPEFRTVEQIANAATGGTPLLAKPDVKTENASDIMRLTEEANKYLGTASSGRLQNIMTQALEVPGISTKASQSDAQLKAIAGQLISKMPRMEGPQSDRDVESYRQAAGDIANANTPSETRKAAIKTIQDLNQKYLPQNQGQNAPTQMMPTPEQAMEILRQRGRKF